METKETNSEKVLEIIRNMSNEEREKLLVEMFYEHYNSKRIKRLEIDWDDPS